jgi:hypothetical protein
MSGPIRLEAAERQARRDAEWPSKPLTVRHFMMCVLLWLLCIFLPPFAVLAGLMYGIIKGAAEGVYDGVRESYSGIMKWWRIVEKE